MLYEKLRRIRENNARQLKVFEMQKADCLPPKPGFIGKCYSCTDFADADRLLKEGLRCIQYSPTCRLVDIEVDWKPRLPHFEVTYILEQLEAQIDDKALERDDSRTRHRKFLEGYTLGNFEAINLHTHVDVRRATSPSGDPVIVKHFTHDTLVEMNPNICEGFRLAHVTHPNSCHLVDIALNYIEKKFHLHLVMQQMPKSLEVDMQQRETPYSEEEVLQCLREVGEVLLHAKRQVLRT